ncbi:MAG: DUF192 domain-containing protein [Nevskiales bacterium]
MIRRAAVLACLFLIAAWGVACAAAPCADDSGQASLRQMQVFLDGDGTRHALAVEVADSAQERARGLMCRRALATDSGMLFIYPEETLARMWMKDTLLALDMLFIASDGRIVKVVEHTQALSEDWVEAKQPVRYVLELKAGSARRLGLKTGDRLRLESHNR